MQLFINREKSLVDFAAFAAGLLANINILDFHTHTHINGNAFMCTHAHVSALVSEHTRVQCV